MESESVSANVSVKIDIRERKLIDVLSEQSAFQVTIEQLEIGDILIEHKDNKILLERKTYSDLLSSIYDGRYKEQKTRMKNSTVAFALGYIIEGDYDITNNIFTSAIVSTMFRDKIYVIFSKNLRYTAEWIKKIAKKMPDFTTETNHSYVECLKMKTKKSSNITKEICYILQLSQIPSISYKVAESIAKVYPTMPILLNALNTSNDPVKLLNQNIDLIGTKKAKIIVEYLLQT